MSLSLNRSLVFDRSIVVELHDAFNFGLLLFLNICSPFWLHFNIIKSDVMLIEHTYIYGDLLQPFCDTIAFCWYQGDKGCHSCSS